MSFHPPPPPSFRTNEEAATREAGQIFVTEPQVELVARQVFDVAGVVGFLNAHELRWEELRRKIDSDLDLGDRDPEYVCELAARLRTMSFDGTGRDHDAHIRHLFETEHGSAFEHAYWCFVVWNVSRSLTHELVRHRIGVSYSQLSQRFVDASDTTFVVHPAIQELAEANPPLFDRWKSHMGASRELYADLTGALGDLHPEVPHQTEHRQAARSVLPDATEAKLFVGAHTRALQRMIETRAHPAADLETRRLFVKVFEIMQRVSPLLMHGMKAVTLDDGTKGVESAYRKV